MMQDTPGASADDRASRSVLLNTFVVKKKRCRVYLHRGTLIWETERPPYTRWTLPLTDVLAVRYGDDWIPGLSVKEKQPTSPTVCPTNFILHYAVRDSKNKWRHHSVTMSHTDPRQIASWVKTIRNHLLGLTYRPRKVMLFINPIGGKKKGIRIWEKDVQPLMTIAGIETKMMVTERAGHIRDILLTADLSDLHAVVCIGGDGTFAEVFNGLILRAVKDQQIDPNDPDVRFPNPVLPVGVIPSGSTDTVAYSLHGTTDVQTAAIHIIFGDSIGLDISSVHSNRTLLRLYASVLSYGYLGDVIRDSEKFRWMGPRRYDWSGFKKIIANKGYEGEIELLSDPCHPASSTRCMKNCLRCLQHMHNSVPDEEITRWVTVSGKFFMVNGANVSCACSRSPMGFSPHCHIGDGCVDVILIRHTSLINNIRLLLRLSSKRKTLYELPFVEVYRAREFTFRSLPTLQFENEVNQVRSNSRLSVWNCDGEVLDNINVKIRVHCQLLKVLHETSSRINSGNDLLHLFHVNIKLNEVVKRLDFKVAIPLRNALESVKVPLSCPVIHPSEIILQYSIYVYIYIRLVKEVYSSFSYVFSYTKKIQKRRRKTNSLIMLIFPSIYVIQIILCYVRLSIIFKK